MKCEIFVKASLLALMVVIFVTVMTETRKKRLPIFPMLIALVILSFILYMRADSPRPEANQEEVIQSSMGLPEDKIIKFVVDKVSDVLRLVPRNVQTTAGD